MQILPSWPRPRGAARAAPAPRADVVERARVRNRPKERAAPHQRCIGCNGTSAIVEIEWSDIEGDAGWSDTKSLNKEQLPVCVSKGYLVSQKNGITRIFTDYIKTKDKPTFDTIGNTTIIPTAVIQSIKKLN